MSSARPALILFYVTCVWGSTFVVTKDVVADAPPFLYLSLRYAIAALALSPWALKQKYSRALLRDGVIVFVLCAVGLICQVLGQVYTLASKSAFITSLSTPLTPLVALLVYRIVPERRQLAGIALAFVGLVLLTYPTGTGAINRGDLLTVAAATIFGFSIVEIARTAPRHSAMAFTFVQIVGAGLIYTLFAVAPLPFPELARLEARPLPHTTRFVAELLYMALVGTALNIAAQTWAMARLTATRSAIIFALEPVIATGLALLVHGAAEWPGPRGAVGAICVVGAVLVSESRVLSRP